MNTFNATRPNVPPAFHLLFPPILTTPITTAPTFPPILYHQSPRHDVPTNFLFHIHRGSGGSSDLQVKVFTGFPQTHLRGDAFNPFLDPAAKEHHRATTGRSHLTAHLQVPVSTASPHRHLCGDAFHPLHEPVPERQPRATRERRRLVFPHRQLFGDVQYTVPNSTGETARICSRGSGGTSHQLSNRHALAHRTHTSRFEKAKNICNCLSATQERVK